MSLEHRAPSRSTLSCHGAADAIASADAPVVALAGTPNAGKSTLFNALTGLRVTTGNWPGTTVEVSRGVWRTPRESASGEIALIDLPGAYSLDPMSPDEELTRNLLVSVPRAEAPDVVVVTVDAAHLARSLYLVAQVRESGLRVVVALTMVDVARNQGLDVDAGELAAALGCPVVAIDPRRRRGIDELTGAVLQQVAQPPASPRALPETTDELELADDRFAWIDAAVQRATSDSGQARVNWSDRIDRVVTAPTLGPLVFLVVMWLVFQITTTVAAPLQDALDTFFSGPVSDAVSGGLTSVGLGETWVHGLLVDGLIAGVGMVLTFAPLMALMFVLLALLEDSGYLARAAVVTDRMMRSIGLPGKAFLPLVVGFGCNVPAISATRILGDARQRLLTVLLVPFTSCSARLTVYVMVGTVFFGRAAGTVVFAMYLVSILFVVLVGLVLRKTLWRSMGTEPLVIDLPPYQVPTLRLTAAVAWSRLADFLRRAGGVIVLTVMLVWLFQSIPAQPGAGGFGEVDVEHSAYAVGAKAITPVFEPTGFAAWQTTSALIVGFVAKETVISSWSQTYAVAEPDGSGGGELGARLIQTFHESSGGHPLPAVLALLVFLLAYTPCVATLAAQRREVGLKWTLFGVAVQFTVAYASAVLIFQVGRLFW
ncbi:ferrous iron transport protein B [Nigerium massiliense]|uniref:ferrous iron transport protein B n=1 Tax=Nigerium massiliense TaxID=1522317 RepID=UPI0005912CFC|nr:ferrous iron transport protein B [Nigerium massiliense]